jgi:hypothetical protein
MRWLTQNTGYCRASSQANGLQRTDQWSMAWTPCITPEADNTEIRRLKHKLRPWPGHGGGRRTVWPESRCRCFPSPGPGGRASRGPGARSAPGSAPSPAPSWSAASAARPARPETLFSGQSPPGLFSSQSRPGLWAAASLNFDGGMISVWVCAE